MEMRPAPACAARPRSRTCSCSRCGPRPSARGCSTRPAAAGLRAAHARAARATPPRWRWSATSPDPRAARPRRGRHPLFLRELARAAPRAATLPATLQARRSSGRSTRSARRAHPARAAPRSQATRSIRSSRRRTAGARSGSAARRWTRLVRPTSVRPHPGARRSRSAIRSSGARSTTRPRPAWRLAAHERAAAALERARRRRRGAGVPRRPVRPRGATRAAIELLRRAAEAASRPRRPTAANWYAAALPLAPGGRAPALVGPLALVARQRGPLEESLARLHEALALDPGEPRADPRLRPRREPARPLRPGPPPPARGARRRPHATLAFELAARGDDRQRHDGAARVGGDDRAPRAPGAPRAAPRRVTTTPAPAAGPAGPASC